jgi:serine hydrolase
MKNEPTILIVPGLRGHVPEHWQTILADELPKAVAVPRLERNKLSCAAWVAAIDRALASIHGPVILVAHSAGVMMVAHWARTAAREIQGALLATPPDLETALPPGYPTLSDLKKKGWMPVPREPLPFPSILAASTNDPIARFDRIVALGNAWGSRVVRVGNVGHLNPVYGFGRWPRAHDFIRELGATQAPRRSVRVSSQLLASWPRASRLRVR